MISTGLGKGELDAARAAFCEHSHCYRSLPSSVDAATCWNDVTLYLEGRLHNESADQAHQSLYRRCREATERWRVAMRRGEP